MRSGTWGDRRPMGVGVLIGGRPLAQPAFEPCRSWKPPPGVSIRWLPEVVTLIRKGCLGSLFWQSSDDSSQDLQTKKNQSWWPWL